MAKIKVGDTVMWRGGFGREAPKPARIVAMDKTEMPREKYGQSVTEADWSEKNYLVVSLNTGNWAYGEQLEPM